MTVKWDRKVRVLAADDSTVMRTVMRELFAPGGELARYGAPEVELCGVAADGVECLEAVARLTPDVLLLDMEMPRVDGLGVLSRLRTEAPGLATIMCSALTARGARTTMEGLALGAADYVMKPTMQGSAEASMKALAADLMPRIAALAGWSGRRGGRVAARVETVARVAPAPAVAPPPAMKAAGSRKGEAEAVVEVVAIGVSTGGPSALEAMLPRLPASFPVPILIVQHMPKLFSAALAKRLNRCCALRVQEAHDGAVLAAGTIWLAPGDSHMEVRPTLDGKGTMARLLAGEAGDLYRPAVDRLFNSVARRYGAGGLALVLTGMGQDGLLGARALRSAGGTVLVQDEASSAVWGMPGRVAEAGLAAAMLPLDGIARELIRITARPPIREAMRVETGRVDAAVGPMYGEMNHGLL